MAEPRTSGLWADERAQMATVSDSFRRFPTVPRPLRVVSTPWFSILIFNVKPVGHHRPKGTYCRRSCIVDADNDDGNPRVPLRCSQQFHLRNERMSVSVRDSGWGGGDTSRCRHQTGRESHTTARESEGGGQGERRGAHHRNSAPSPPAPTTVAPSGRVHLDCLVARL